MRKSKKRKQIELGACECEWRMREYAAQCEFIMSVRKRQ